VGIDHGTGAIYALPGKLNTKFFTTLVLPNWIQEARSKDNPAIFGYALFIESSK
jgi:hypothetical protein